METKTNLRKAVATLLHDAALASRPGPEGHGPYGLEEVTVTPDATNPYAFVVVTGGKRFRVLVKEVA